MQFLVVGCSKSLERSGMMPIIMDDQSWNVKNKECSLHQTMREKITQIELNQLANILYYACLPVIRIICNEKKNKKQKQMITDLNKNMTPNHFKIFKWILTPLFLENTYRCIKLKLMKRNYLYFLSIICSGYYCSVNF